MYELNFKKINGKLFVSLRGNLLYDKQTCDGYFYRDGRLIVLYGTDYADDCLDNNWEKSNGNGIPNFKFTKSKSLMTYPKPLLVRMRKNKTVKKVSIKESLPILLTW